MRVLLDANVLFPTVLREVLLGVAAAGLYAPLWSARVLEEWARATRKLGPGAEGQARAEIAALTARWPRALVAASPATEARLWLPDPHDIHVLAAAVDGSADLIVTFNRRDFPRGEVAGEGIGLRDPDGFLMDRWLDAPAAVAGVAAEVRERAAAMGHPMTVRALLKRSGLPRLGRALDPPGG